MSQHIRKTVQTVGISKTVECWSHHQQFIIQSLSLPAIGIYDKMGRYSLNSTLHVE